MKKSLTFAPKYGIIYVRVEKLSREPISRVEWEIPAFGVGSRETAPLSYDEMTGKP